MEPVRTRAEIRPSKPFLFRTTGAVVPFAYYDSIAGVFVNGGAIVNDDEVTTLYPLIRARKVRLVMSSPTIRMYNQYVVVAVTFQGIDINGQSNVVYLQGTVDGLPIESDCDLLISPKFMPGLGVSFDVNMYAMNDYATSAGDPAIPIEYSAFIEITGEYVDI